MAALFHIGKLVAEGGDGRGGQGFGEICHDGGIHSGAGSVPEDEKIFGFRRRQQEGGDFPAGRGFEAEVSYFGHLTDFSRNLPGWAWVRGVLKRFTRANVLGFEEGSRDKAARKKRGRKAIFFSRPLWAGLIYAAPPVLSFFCWARLLVGRSIARGVRGSVKNGERSLVAKGARSG